MNHLAVRTEQSRILSEAAKASGDGVILAGDFNTPPDGRIYHGWWCKFDDSFSTAGWGLGHTYFGEKAAVRIDHIMTGSGWRCRMSQVERTIGSPHHPLVAELDAVR